MKRVPATIALMVFAFVAVSINAERLNSEALRAAATISNPPWSSAGLSTATSSARQSLAAYPKKAPSAIALAEGACASGGSSPLRLK